MVASSFGIAQVASSFGILLNPVRQSGVSLSVKTNVFCCASGVDEPLWKSGKSYASVGPATCNLIDSLSAYTEPLRLSMKSYDALLIPLFIT